jgi:hypothetical protein
MTPTVLASATATETVTAPVSATPTRAATARPTATATAPPVQPTGTATDRPPSPTATASPRPTTVPAGPVILSFTTSTDIADPGDTITLSWTTSNATMVTLYRMMPTGQFGSFWTVEPQGTFTYEINPLERNRTHFVLAARDAADNHVNKDAVVTLRCPDEWFFESAPDICPANAAIVSAGAEQQFEHGVAIWVEGELGIYILFEHGQYSWLFFQDAWQPGEPESDPALEPPPGLYQPVRGFGKVWREQPGVRERLGWALAPEIGFTTAVQRTSYAKYNETYLRASDGNVWKLGPERSAWEKIPAQG